ncbi:MAG: hypothetical protein OWU84_11785 [Firmicutes bacterium]|nr:hypothetical protein [Bacillota bacterium]
MAFQLGANYWSRAGGPRMWVRYDPTLVDEELRWGRELGLTQLRWFLYWPDFEPEPGHDNEDVWTRVADFLQRAAHYGFETFPTLLVGHMSGQNWDPPWRDGRDLWTDPDMVEREAQFIHRAVRRLSAQPAVTGWILTNEWPLWAGPTTPETFARWIQRMVDAVRSADPGHRPISLGDGLWNAQGGENGIRLDVVAAKLDVLGPHVYPEGRASLRIPYGAYLACQLAGEGKPVWLEEFGTTDAFGEGFRQAEFYRSQLVGALAAGADRAWAWCLTDFDLKAEPPYSHHPFELRFGLRRTDGAVKPNGQVMAEFSERVRTWGETQKDPLAVVVPALQFGAVPFRRGPENLLMTRVAESMLVALASLGFNPRVLREPAPDSLGSFDIPSLEGVEAAFLVAPRISVPMQEALWRWVAAGGRLYIAYSDTFWFHDMAQDLGVVNVGPYNQREVRSGQLSLTGDGAAWTWHTDDPIPAVHLESRGARPWLFWADGEPALFRWPVGRGEILVAGGGWELSTAPDALLYSLYRRILDEWQVPRRYQASQPGLLAARSRQGRVVMVNQSDAPLEVTLAEPLQDERGQRVAAVRLAAGGWWWGGVV